MNALAITLILASCSILSIHGYKSGAGESSCDTLIPGHGLGAVGLDIPFSITTSSSDQPNVVNVTILAAGSNKFKGFLVKPTIEGMTDTGVFQEQPNTKIICSGSAITHTDGDTEKQARWFQWAAPPGSEGKTVEFQATVVENAETYYAGLSTGIELESTTTTTPTTTPTTTATTTPAPTTTTLRSAQDNIIDVVRSEIGQSQWGLNTAGGLLGQETQNRKTTSRRENSKTIFHILNEDVLPCFAWICLLGLGYIILRIGVPDFTKRHRLVIKISRCCLPLVVFVVFSSIVAVDAQEASGGSPKFIPLDPECGKTRGCFHDCKGGQCSFIVTWKAEGDKVNFHMKKIEPATSDRWLAIAFSNDEYMGDDSCHECVIVEGVVKVYTSYNDGKNNKRLDNPTAGLSNTGGSYVNGVLECSFDRVKRNDFYKNMMDIDHHVFLMYADGEAIDGTLFPHDYSKLPPVSQMKVDLNSLVNIGGEGHRYPLVLTHGCIMIVTWVLLTGIALVTARYGKPLMPKTHFFGLKIWFQIHRTCTSLAVCLTVLSVLLAVVEAEGYSKIPDIPGKKFHQLHPPLGIIVAVLTIINPIMALFRPGPETVGRPIFNWAHWAVGVFSQVLAILTMFIGLDLTKAGSLAEPMIALTLYIVFVAGFIVTMELLPHCIRIFTEKKAKFELSTTINLRRASHKGYDVSPPSPTPPTAPVPVVSQPEPDPQKEHRVKCILLLVFYIITGIFTVVMVTTLATY